MNKNNKGTTLDLSIENVLPDLEATTEGKLWKNKITGGLFSGEVYLSEIRFINGKELDEPIVETPEHYELIDIEPTEPSTV